MNLIQPTSVSNLLRYKSKSLRSTCPKWFQNLNHFITRHFVEESRPHIKVIAIGHISRAALANMETHEEEIIEIILRYFKCLDHEPVIVRTAAVNFIVDWLMEGGGSKRSHDLIHVLERVRQVTFYIYKLDSYSFLKLQLSLKLQIANAPFEGTGTEGAQSQPLPPDQVTDVHAAVHGLIRLFIKKIYHLPSSIPMSCYKIIVRHLSNQYRKTRCLELCPSIRYMVSNRNRMNFNLVSCKTLKV